MSSHSFVDQKLATTKNAVAPRRTA